MSNEQEKQDAGRKQFLGFIPPEKNWFPMPTCWTDISAEIDSLAELKVVEYVLRHTWGYREFGITKTISVDEFMKGRRRQDGSRMDKGTGLKSDRSVKDGLKLAIEHGYLTCDVDDSDQARIKKSYGLRMFQSDQGCNLPPVVSTPGSIYPSEGQYLPLRGVVSTPRSEKDTLERKPKKERDSAPDGASLIALFEKLSEEEKQTFLQSLTSNKEQPQEPARKETAPHKPALQVVPPATGGKPTKKAKHQITLAGQHILDLYQEVRGGRKVTLNDDNIKAANGLGEVVESDEDFRDVHYQIKNDPFLKERGVRTDLDFMYRKYDGFFDKVVALREAAAKKNAKPSPNGVPPSTGKPKVGVSGLPIFNPDDYQLPSGKNRPVAAPVLTVPATPRTQVLRRPTTASLDRERAARLEKKQQQNNGEQKGIVR